MPHPTNRSFARSALCALVAAALVPLAAASLAYAQAEVTTNQLDYYPGDVVVISGSGFWPGEQVSLRLDQYPTLHEPFVFYATADSTGAFQNSDYTVQDQDLATSFDLTATGMTSGLIATTFFTDSPKVGYVSVEYLSGVMCHNSGGSVAYTVTVNRGSGSGSSGSFTAALSITSALPSGMTASFAPNPVSFTPGQSTRTTTLTLSAPGAVAAGSTGLTIRAATSANDFATGTEVVTVNAPPTVTPPAAITRNSTPGQCGAAVTFAATATGSPAPTTTYSPASGSFFPVGTTTVTATASNSCGSASTTFTITVVDNEKPSITVADLTRATDPGSCSATIAVLGATAADNCAVASFAGTRGDGLALTDPFPQGSTTIDWLATDTSGNTAGATQYVMVADTEHPTVTAPAPLSLTTGAGSQTCGVTVGSAALGTPVAHDNCAVDVTVTGIPAGNLFPVGTTTITYTAKDPSGNTTVATQTVTVEDDTPPVNLGGESIYKTDPGSCGATVRAFGRVESDNCGIQTSIGTRSDGLSLGDPFPVGTTTITWVVTDIHGNSTSATELLHVEDHEAPSIAAPAAVQAVTGSGARICGAVITDAALGQPVTADNCSVVLTRSGIPADNLFPVGGTTITWTATDPSGNASSTTQLVTVTDNTPPTLSVPAALNLGTDPNATTCGLVVPDATLGFATASDNCSVTLSRTGVPAGNLFPTGTTTITYVATDPSGNSVSATQWVTIADSTPPRITAADITRGPDAGTCTAAIADLGASATDNCGAPSLTGVRGDARPLSDPYPRGATTIVWTATDASGGTTTATQTITVENPAPVALITAPASGFVVPIGTPVALAGSFTDEAGDVHSATWTCDAFTCPASVNEAARTISGSMTFTAPGVYRLRLVVTDACGQSSTATVVSGLDAMIVVYDPSAGFVTGGGWIQSPAGACASNPLLTGKANFGFVSRYKKGMTVPTGETEFQFKAGDVNFHSAAYEWLVISGARAQYKGTGTINGAGNYGFMLSSVDGQMPGGGGSDKFRIKITDKASGQVVYDNMMGAPDSAAAATLLGGGSIQIQTQGGKSGTLDAVANASAPAVSGLAQNRPNPFNPETTLRFAVARSGHATLRIFNARGALVRTLVDGTMEPGTHEVRWNGMDQHGGRSPSGVYYALFEAGEGARNRIRMVLIK